MNFITNDKGNRLDDFSADIRQEERREITALAQRLEDIIAGCVNAESFEAALHTRLNIKYELASRFCVKFVGEAWKTDWTAAATWLYEQGVRA